MLIAEYSFVEQDFDVLIHVNVTILSDTLISFFSVTHGSLLYKFETSFPHLAKMLLKRRKMKTGRLIA